MVDEISERRVCTVARLSTTFSARPLSGARRLCVPSWSVHQGRKRVASAVCLSSPSLQPEPHLQHSTGESNPAANKHADSSGNYASIQDRSHSFQLRLVGLVVRRLFASPVLPRGESGNTDAYCCFDSRGLTDRAVPNPREGRKKRHALHPGYPRKILSRWSF